MITTAFKKKEFLYYPHVNKQAASAKTDNKTLFYIIKNEEDCNKHSYIFDAEFCSLVGDIDDSMATSANLVCTATVDGIQRTFTGANRNEEAEKWVDLEIAMLMDKYYPQGVHFVEESIYIGNSKAGRIRADGGRGVIELNLYHKNKFFFAGEEGQDEIYTDASNVESMQAAVTAAYNPTRYEKEKTAAIEAKTEAARKTADFMGLKPLTGSVKQKKWGEEIRAKFLQTCTHTQAAKAKRSTTAKFWIDNRNNLDGKF